MKVYKEIVKMSVKDYNFYLEQEVLTEFTAEILAEFLRYFEANNIDTEDKTNATVIIFDELCKLKNTFYSTEIQNIDDLKIIEEKFLFSKSVLKKLSRIEKVA